MSDLHQSRVRERVPILAVDDRRENLLALEAALGSDDYELVRAESGDEAVARVFERNFALILLDVAMPGMDGYETARLIRSREKSRGVPIIFVTAFKSEPKQIFRGYEEGAVDYLVKPLDLHALRMKVSVFADLYRAAREIERSATARERAEHEARMLTEALYDVTFEDAPIGIGHVSADGRWLRANERMAHILGVRPGTLRGDAVLEFVHADDREPLAADMDDVFAGRKVRLRRQCRLVSHDGREVFINITLSVIRDTEGHAVQLAIIEDVSEEKRLARALESSERRFAQLRESGLLGVYEENAQGSITAANDAFLSMLGYTREDLAEGQLRAGSFVAPSSVQTEASSRRELERTGIATAQEKALLRKDGRVVTVLAGGVANGGVLGFTLDVTAQREAERIRARSTSELEASLRARDDFLALLAHELRTPLTPLIMQITSLRTTLASRTGAVESTWMDREVAVVQRAATRLSRLTEDLLAVSRATVGGFELAREKLDLAALVREVVDRSRMELSRTRADVQVSGERHVYGSFDRTMLERVVSQLLSNAIKYGAGRPIDVSVEADDETVTLTFRDRGIGVPEEAREQLFQRFARFAPVQHYGGLGIGLWLVRAIVEAHGGTVEAADAPGGGAKFVVRVPRRAQPRTSNGDDVAAQHRNLLLVDDDDDIREILRIGLENAGYGVRDAANGKEALDELAKEVPDLVLLDLMMPVMTGAEFLSQVRADNRYRNLPVLLLTAWPAEAQRLRGAQGVIGKPLDLAQLTHTIEQAL